ncbi:MAG TPA: DUF3293 domain-containing protein [Pirellulaceae bacterium]|nr:DUF3293 domain-containing protein [Pirellulaceae bacterium]
MAENLHQIYLQTQYEIFALRTLLTIGQQNEVVNGFLRRHRAEQFAFLTAWNPQSRLLDDAENRARNLLLAAELVSWPYLLGTTRGPHPAWPGEESFFVIDIPLHRALEIANQYDQNAIVFGRIDCPADLVFANEAARLRCQPSNPER